MVLPSTLTQQDIRKKKFYLFLMLEAHTLKFTDL